MQVIEKFYATKKILGICLGHQCIAQFFGANVIEYDEPCHGKTSEIFFKTPSTLYKNVKNGFLATRYHSLIVDNLPDSLVTTSMTKDNLIMSIEHKTLPIYGTQYHPESILTTSGKTIIQNFVNMK